MSLARFTYSPKDTSEPEKVIFAGQEWEAGKTADLKDESFLTILMGNPFFVRNDKPKDGSVPVPLDQAPAPAKPDPGQQMSTGPKPPIEPRPVDASK